MKILQYTLRIFMLLMLISSSAWAGGLYIREFGQPTQGMSGGQVLAEDASLAFQNPSGLFKLDWDGGRQQSRVRLGFLYHNTGQ
ncbi:MAG: hypothetical protein KAR12_04535 [Methylococcales bacterium]|nr:hypothetical protein [Methylococcales bacterium]